MQESWREYGITNRCLKINPKWCYIGYWAMWSKHSYIVEWRKCMQPTKYIFLIPWNTFWRQYNVLMPQCDVFCTISQEWISLNVNVNYNKSNGTLHWNCFLNLLLKSASLSFIIIENCAYKLAIFSIEQWYKTAVWKASSFRQVPLYYFLSACSHIITSARQCMQSCCVLYTPCTLPAALHVLPQASRLICIRSRSANLLKKNMF